MKIRPLSNWVLVRRQKPPEKTASGLYLPPTAQSQQITQADRGEVLAVGPGIKMRSGPVAGTVIPIDFGPGSTVFFEPSNAAAQDLSKYGEGLVMLRAWDCLALLETSPEAAP